MQYCEIFYGDAKIEILNFRIYNRYHNMLSLVIRIIILFCNVILKIQMFLLATLFRRNILQYIPGLPGSKIPPATHSRSLLKASPGLRGPPAVLITFSVNSSSA